MTSHETRTIVVFPGNGRQGSSVVERFARSQHFKVRAVVRDPHKKGTKELGEHSNVELVTANYELPSTYVKGRNVFDGAYAGNIYS
jgi:uncharacterized protein YbjT (DUF2867 family)